MQPDEKSEPFTLSPELLDLMHQQFDAHIRLFSGYADIHDRAVAGQKITGADFKAIEKAYDDVYQAKDPLDGLEFKVRRQIYLDSVKVVPEYIAGLSFNEDWLSKAHDAWETGKEDILRAKRQWVEDQITAHYTQRYDEKMDGWVQEHPDIIAKIEDTAPLNKVFYETYVVGHEKKNTQVPEGITNHTQLFAELFSKNRFIGIADVHSQEESLQLTAKQAPTLALAGPGATLYIESSQNWFDRVNQLQATELRQLAKNGRYQRDERSLEITLDSSSDTARVYHVKHADYVTKAWVEMLATAKEYGIRVVPIDTYDSVKDASMGYADAMRIPSTNFIWVDAIRDDMAQQEAKGQPVTKAFVFGGAAHMTNHSFLDKGMVDEALAMPVVGFEPPLKAVSKAFHKGSSVNGADFYLAASADYPDMQSRVKAQDLEDISLALKKMPHIPGPLPQIIATGLDLLSFKLRYDAHIRDDELSPTPNNSLGQLPRPSLPGLPADPKTSSRE